MSKQQLKTKRGFTIIEVVLVLAIAGLIFMMVFLALPALQRSQRDTQRRDDMSRVASQLQQYQANNRGAIPTTTTELTSFMTNYLRTGTEGSTSSGNDEFLDPDGEEYAFELKGSFFTISGSASTVLTGDQTPPVTSIDHKIYYYVGGRCEGEKIVKATGKRNAAFFYKLEGAGTYCGNI